MTVQGEALGTSGHLMVVPGEKPLHVRVAEVLGFSVRDGSRECRGQCVSAIEDGGDFPRVAGRGVHRHGGWEFWEADWEEGGDWRPVPRYDLDWAATGPLIEKHRIRWESPGALPGSEYGAFPEVSMTAHGARIYASGPTLLKAVCGALLWAQAGKLL